MPEAVEAAVEAEVVAAEAAEADSRAAAPDSVFVHLSATQGAAAVADFDFARSLARHAAVWILADSDPQAIQAHLVG